MKDDFVSIREVCDVYDGPHATPPPSEEGPIYLGIKAITADCRLDPMQFKHISVYDFPKWIKRVQPKAHDIVFSYEATLGRYAIIPDDFYGCLGRRLALVRVKDEHRVNYKYLYYYFQSQEWKSFIDNNIVSGSTVNRISVDDFPNYQIRLPDIKVQNKLVNILDKLDKKIETNNILSSKLEGLAGMIYDYWFLQFDFPDENGRPYKSSGGKMVWNTELKREIPEGWEVLAVKDCIEHIKTGLNPRNNFKLGNGNIKYITVKNITTMGSIDWSSCDVIDKNARDIVHMRSDVSKGDILFASIAPLGRCVLVEENPIEWDINESVFSIRPNYTIISSEYLYLYFMSDLFVKKAEHSSTGSVFSGIRIKVLEDIPIIVPAPAVMRAFSNILKPIFLDKYILEKENQHLISMRNYLMPLLINGQISFK